MSKFLHAHHCQFRVISFLKNDDGDVLIGFIKTVVANEQIFLVEAYVQVGRLLDVNRVVPSAHHNRMFVFRPYVDGHKLALYANFVPVLNFADTGILECLL